MKLKGLFFGMASVAALLASGASPAQDAKSTLAESDSGTVWFATAGRLARDPANGALTPHDEPETLSGALYFPEGKGRGPFPAVVLAHGCGGPGNADAGWASALREWGYATFVLDSFRGRKLREVCTNATALTGTQRIPDAYGALRLLATHPRVDSKRIALMGFSHGGILTVAAATAWARDRYLAKDTPGFRAFFPFYPYCNTKYPEVESLAAPVRIHTGALDDWTPAAPCEEMVKRARAAGQDADLTLYEGAHHSFDNIGVPVTRYGAAQNYGKCYFSAPTILGPFTGQPVAECRTLGATLGLNDRAMTQARANVRRQLEELLK